MASPAPPLSVTGASGAGGRDLVQHHRGQGEDPAAVADDGLGQGGGDGQDDLRLEGEAPGEAPDGAAGVHAAVAAGVLAVLGEAAEATTEDGLPASGVAVDHGRAGVELD